MDGRKRKTVKKEIEYLDTANLTDVASENNHEFSNTVESFIHL